jgi:hypothetical protein
MSSSSTLLISRQSGSISVVQALSIWSASRSRAPAGSVSIRSMSAAPGFPSSSRDRISSDRTSSRGVDRTRAISVLNFAREAFGGGVRKSGVKPVRGWTAFSRLRSSLPAATRRRLVIPLLLASQLPAIAFVVTPSVPLAAVLLAIAGTGYAFNQGVDPIILAATDPAYRGRLFTVQTSGLMAIQGVSIALAGVIGTLIRPGLTIPLAGVLGTVITLVRARRALTTE